MNKPFIFLDVGDTLLTLTKDPGQIYFDILKKHSIISSEFTYNQLSKLFFAAWKDMSQNIPSDYRDRYSAYPNGYDGWWKELIYLFVKKAGYNGNIPEFVLAQIFTEFDSISTWKIEPGFFTLEEYCTNNQIRLGIISNWDLRLRGLLSKLKLLSKFEPVIISAEFGFEKPSPKIFEEAMRLSNQKPENLIYVGDKPELDYLPPTKLGWTSYIISPKKISNYPCIQTLSDLIPIIEKRN